MKKFLIAGIISILACSANAASFHTEVVTHPTQTEVVKMYVTYSAKKPKVITKGDRVIIIYDNGRTVVVDRDGTVVVVP